MKLNEYQEMCMRTAQEHESLKDALLESVLGLGGEAGEAVDNIKKHVYNGHELDKDKQALELGDILYYVAWHANVLGYTLDQIATMNQIKLRRRFPNGYQDTDSVLRVDKKMSKEELKEFKNKWMEFSKDAPKLEIMDVCSMYPSIAFNKGVQNLELKDTCKHDVKMYEDCFRRKRIFECVNCNSKAEVDY